MVTSLIQLLCRMTKLGWFDDDGYRTVVDDAQKLLEKGTQVSISNGLLMLPHGGGRRAEAAGEGDAGEHE